MFPYFVVKGKSMEPLCKEGDFVVLDKLSYFMTRPRVGDTVILQHPLEQNRLILKYILQEKIYENRFLYWVEGLNKKGSSDSRTFGWIPRELILGKARIIQKGGQKRFANDGSFMDTKGRGIPNIELE